MEARKPEDTRWPEGVAPRFGLKTRSFQLLINAIEARPEIRRAIIFGSRAMGNAKHGSDIDLAIEGPQVTEWTAEELSRELNERLPIPYYTDVVVYHSGTHDHLHAHIDTEGEELFRREEG